MGFVDTEEDKIIVVPSEVMGCYAFPDVGMHNAGDVISIRSLIGRSLLQKFEGENVVSKITKEKKNGETR